jgi:hypothetical protein
VNKSEEEEADVVDADFRNTGQTNHSLVILVSVEYRTSLVVQSDSENILQKVHWLDIMYRTMDQITIKTPNPKCRLYWCLI